MNNQIKLSKLGKTSVKKKLVILPLIIIFLAISGIAFVSSYLLRESLLKQMRSQGMEYVDKIVSEIDVNASSLNIINNLVDSQIKKAGRIISRNEDNLSNEFLINLAKDLEIDELNYYDQTNKILFSNQEGNLEWVAPASHPASIFNKGNSKEFIEAIRKSNTDNNFYKYGYAKTNAGNYVQVGVLANVINELTERFSYQTLVNDIAKVENVVYALFIDKNLTAIAHSNKGRIGIKLSDEGSISASQKGKEFSSEFLYEGDGDKVHVYDVLKPVYVNGQHIGAINIGLSMKEVNQSVQTNIKYIIALALVFFGLLSTVLYLTSNTIVKTLKTLKDNLELVAHGDFTVDVDEKYLKLSDEFGDISNSIENMKDSIKQMIRDIKDKSKKLVLILILSPHLHNNFLLHHKNYLLL